MSNAALQRYIELLRRIVKLPEESREGDELRVRMDVLWYSLTPEEIEEVTDEARRLTCVNSSGY